MRLSNKSTNFAILASILFTLRVHQHTSSFVEKGDQQTSQVFLRTIRAHAQILEYII